MIWIAVGLLLLPARIIEEGLHALVALPWAVSVSVSINPRQPSTAVHWRDDTPRWAQAIAHVAPELVASIAGLAVLGWWTAGGSVPLPGTTLDWVLLWWLGAQYLAVVAPEQGGVGGVDGAA